MRGKLTTSYTLKTWQGEDITVSRDINEMKKGIQPIRIRAGLHDYTAEEYADANKLRAKIKRERMIEFMGEGKRYFDLVRTGKAASVLTPANDSGNFRTKAWTPDVRYLPIPQDNIDAAQGTLKQNGSY